MKIIEEKSSDMQSQYDASTSYTCYHRAGGWLICLPALQRYAMKSAEN